MSSTQAAARIVLFGASGYTGALTANAMVARGLAPLLAGRDGKRLQKLGAELGGLKSTVADVGRPTSVRELLGPGDVMVSTVGPFARWGNIALDAAIDAGAHYMDSCGEPAFNRRVFEAAGSRNTAAGCTLLSALGYKWALGNLAGALALREGGEAASGVRIAYFMNGEMRASRLSGGTRASLAGSLLEPGFCWRDGRLRRERGAARFARFKMGGRSRGTVSVAGAEALALPSSFPALRDVEVYLGWFGAASRLLVTLSSLSEALLGLPGARTGVARALRKATNRSSGGPGAELRARSGSEVVAEALDRDASVLASVRLTGVDCYSFSASFLAWAAEQAALGKLQGSGAIGPVQAFGLERLEAGVAEAGIRRV